MIPFLAGLVVGFGIASFFWHTLANPVAKLRRKAMRDIRYRLTPDGMPINALNDYERHLFALWSKRHRKGRFETLFTLFMLAQDVAISKRLKYINEVLNSVIVQWRATEGGLIDA